MTYAYLPPATLRKGAAISAVSGLCFASSVVFVRYAYSAGVLPGMAVFLRFTVAAFVLALFLTLTGGWVRLSKHHMLAIFLLGFIGFSIMGTTYYVALSVTPAWLIALFAALYPLTVNVASWLFLREGMTKHQLVALVSVLLGGILLFWQPFESTAWLGILLMCVNVTAVTIYLLVGQHWTRGIPPVMSATWTVIGAALGTSGYALFTDQISFAFAPTGWLWIFCFGIVSTALAILTSWWGISLIGAARSSIIGSFEPLVAVLLAVLVLGEQVTGAQIVGGVFILAGMFLVQWQPAGRGTPAPAE